MIRPRDYHFDPDCFALCHQDNHYDPDFHYQCDQCDYFDHVCMNVTVVFENHDDEYDDADDADGDEYGSSQGCTPTTSLTTGLLQQAWII